MKKSLRKVLAVCTATLTLAAISATSLLTVAAQEPVSTPVVQTETTSDGGENISRRFDDVIVTKYRLYNGKMQYRRWNETTGTWVDPYWIDL